MCKTSQAFWGLLRAQRVIPSNILYLFFAAIPKDSNGVILPDKETTNQLIKEMDEANVLMEKSNNELKKDYKKQGYIFMSSENIYKSVVKLLHSATQ